MMNSFKHSPENKSLSIVKENKIRTLVWFAGESPLLIPLLQLSTKTIIIVGDYQVSKDIKVACEVLTIKRTINDWIKLVTNSKEGMVIDISNCSKEELEKILILSPELENVSQIIKVVNKEIIYIPFDLWKLPDRKRRILLELLQAEQASGIELSEKLAVTSSGTYQHTTLLMKDQLIEKVAEGYQLTKKGKAYAEFLAMLNPQLKDL